MITQDEIIAYQKSCIQRSCAVNYEGKPLCANCNADLIDDETHVCTECARLLLEGEVTERGSSESNG